MALEDVLEELTERRLTFKAFREQVDADLRALRVERLGAEQAGIEHLVVRAAAAGATTGQIKRAYGTKDHRTVTTILANRASEIDAIRNAAAEKARGPEWFRIKGETAIVTIGEWTAEFTWTEVDGELMFTTDTNPWNDDFTVKNEAVTLLDGKTENESEEAGILAKAIREA